MSKIVIGLNFGDEGKGLTTSFLCANSQRYRKPLVVRFNGGQQAGHTVNYNGNKHIFSGFGSGTLQDVPTYWSEYCTFYPNSFLREYDILDNMLLKSPVIYVNPLCPVTTPFDIDSNRAAEKIMRVGSVGMGFGATIQRQQDYYKLFVQDLFFENILIQKLRAIAKYYNGQDVDAQIEHFLKSVKRVKEIITLSDNSIIREYYPIFEGAQGVLLDMDFGFFPNVTRSNTTTKNAIKLIPQEFDYSEVFYVTRCYMTRHGNGYMGKGEPVVLKNNEGETNKQHEYQGTFRTSAMDFELMNYALSCDNNFSKYIAKNLVITCTDQLDTDIDLFLSKINGKFRNVYISDGNSLNNIKLYK